MQKNVVQQKIWKAKRKQNKITLDAWEKKATDFINMYKDNLNGKFYSVYSQKMKIKNLADSFLKLPGLSISACPIVTHGKKEYVFLCIHPRDILTVTWSKINQKGDCFLNFEKKSEWIAKEHWYLIAIIA